MAVTCPIITITAPPPPSPTNITCTLFEILNPASKQCTAPCNITFRVKWKNIGGQSGQFEPGTSLGLLGLGMIHLSPGQEVQYEATIFGVNNTHTLCPIPN